MIFKGLSLIFLGLGIFVLVQVIMPLLAFGAFELFTLDKNSLLLDPNPRMSQTVVLGESDEQSFEGSPHKGVLVENIGNFPAFISSGIELIKPEYGEFYLSIPKLNLKKVKVLVSSNDFEENLAQLPGSALPGERGNIFVTGHSSIPFNLQKKRTPFFLNLPNIKKDDEITVQTPNGQNFTYLVVGLRVVDPQDITVIDPPESEGRYLTLMTCVPPGFNIKRLIVLSKLKT